MAFSEVVYKVEGTPTRRKQRIMQQSFEALPNELLVHIMGFLDSSSLNTMALVNRKFSGLVDKTLNLTDLLPLTIQTPITRQTLPTGARRYRELRIKNFDIWRVYMKKFLLKVGLDLRRLSMRNCSLQGNNLAEVLSCLPKLESCCFENCNALMSDDLAVINLPELRVLKLVNSEVKLNFHIFLLHLLN